jgi:hypothetical protein
MPGCASASTNSRLGLRRRRPREARILASCTLYVFMALGPRTGDSDANAWDWVALLSVTPCRAEEEMDIAPRGVSAPRGAAALAGRLRGALQAPSG